MKDKGQVMQRVRGEGLGTEGRRNKGKGKGGDEREGERRDEKGGMEM